MILFKKKKSLDTLFWKYVMICIQLILKHMAQMQKPQMNRFCQISLWGFFSL